MSSHCLATHPAPALRPRRPHARAALVASLVALASLLAPAYAAPAAADPHAEGVLSVRNVNGKAAELLHRLTIPQLAAVLDTTPARLGALIESSEGEGALVRLQVLLGDEQATLQGVLDRLAQAGVSTAPTMQVIGMLLAGVTATGEELRATVAELLADLREDGQIKALAEELTLPPAALEIGQLSSATAVQVAGTLNTSVDHLGSLLTGAGAVAQPLAATAPVVIERLTESPREGTTTVIGVPTGGGTLSFTTVNSQAASPGRTVAGLHSSASARFSIVSIRVLRGGAIRESVRVPTVGRVTIGASAVKRFAHRATGGRLRTLTRRATVAAVSRNVTAGVQVFTLHPHGVSRTAALAVTLTTTYAPVGGSKTTLRRVFSYRAVKVKRVR